MISCLLLCRLSGSAPSCSGTTLSDWKINGSLLWAFLVAFSSAVSLSAQSLPFINYSSDEGLSESVVLAAQQDRWGYLWLATPQGVSRFDGLDFTHFGPRDGVPEAKVRSIYESRAGVLWLATDDGLASQRGVRFASLTLTPPGILKDARCLIEDVDGSLWVGTHGGGIVRLKPNPALSHLEDEWVVEAILDQRQGLPHLGITAALQDRAGDLWFATEGGGVARYVPRLAEDQGQDQKQLDAVVDTALFVSYGKDRGLDSLSVHALAEGAEGHLLAGTEGGLFVLRNGHFEPQWTEVLGQEAVTTLLVDRRQRLWMGTREKGVCVAEGEALRCFGSASGLATGAVTDLLEDREGHLWITTSGGGISLLASEGWVHYSTAQGLPQGSVQAVHPFRGEIWFASRSSGAMAWNADGVSRRLSTTEGLPHDNVLALTTSTDGELWLGTSKGVARWNGQQLDVLTSLDGRVLGQVADMIASLPNELWLGTDQGLHRLRGDPFGSPEHRLFGVEDGLPSPQITAMAVDEMGQLWLATSGGVARQLSDDHFEFLQLPEAADLGRPDAPVSDLLRDDDGGWWFCTADGLRQLRGDTWRLLLPSGIASHGSCTALAVAPDGRLWMGTTHGIHIFDGQELSTLSMRDGLISADVQPRATFVDSENQVWFGTAGGVIAFGPEAGRQAVAIEPRIHLQAMTVAGGKPLYPQGDLPLQLEPPHHDLRFEMAAISLSYAEEVTFRYRLDPLDATWRDLHNGHLEYPSLPPGDYRLTAQAHHRGGWSDPLAVSFRIVPPWWATVWSRVLFLLAGLGLVYLGYRFRLRLLKQQQAELERQVALRTAEVDREKGRVKRRNDRLEMHHLIMQQINAELDFSNLLQSILEGICFMLAADRAFAMVLDQETGDYVQRASHGGSEHASPNPRLSRQDLEVALLDRGRTISSSLYIGKPKEGMLPEDFAPLPSSFVVMTIELEGKPAGHLVVGHTRGEGELGDVGIRALEGIEDHVTSAFIKGRMLDELRRLNAKKNEFLGIAAHDLRSPLGGVMSCADLLLRLLDEGRFEEGICKKFLNNMRLTSQQMLAMVNELLDVASIETGRVELNMEEACMADLLEERRSLLENLAKDKEIDLSLDLDKGTAEVPMDRLRVAEVLDNLLTNAIKYTPRGGAVKVYCQTLADELVTHIEDTGQGLAEKEVPWVFSGRKLSSKTTEGESSHGLGLVIVKKLVELHGGRIWLRSKLGCGSTFSFALPRLSHRSDPKASGAPAER